MVNPMEVVKIRLQAQQHSLADPLEVPRYRNAAHALYTIIREEGFLTLYRGVALTAARQATNQGVCQQMVVPDAFVMRALQADYRLFSPPSTPPLPSVSLNSCQLHCIPGAAGAGSAHARHKGPALVRDSSYWVDLWRTGAIQQRAH